MDDLLGKLQQILASEEGQAQLREVASMLGMDDGGQPDLSVLDGLFGQSGERADAPPGRSEPDSGSPDMGTLMKLLGAFSAKGGMGKDKNTQLLYALKPHLKEENQHKVDEAAKLLRLISLLPLLRESGIFGEGGIL